MTCVADATTHGTGRYRAEAARLSGSEFPAEIAFFALNLREADLACNAKLSQRIAGIYQWPN